jgi:hypothetical protein
LPEVWASHAFSQCLKNSRTAIAQEFIEAHHVCTLIRDVDYHADLFVVAYFAFERGNAGRSAIALHLWLGDIMRPDSFARVGATL